MKIANTRTKIAVGGFALFVVAAAVVAVMMVGEGMDSFKAHRRYSVSFPDASGLQDGAPVKIGGLTVGNVRNLHIEFVEGATAAVADLEVIEPHFNLVRTDSKAMLETQGVLGDKYVSLVGSSPAAAQVADGSRIASVKVLTFQDVTTRANEILGDLEGTMVNVRQLSNKILAKGGLIDVASDPRVGQQLRTSLERFEKAGTSLENVAGKIDQGQGTIGLLVNDSGLYDDAKSILGRSNRSKVARTLVQEALRKGEIVNQPIAH